MNSIIIGVGPKNEAQACIKAYSSFEPYELADYLDALAICMPDVAITIERMPTALLTERLLAERDAPKADMILGWAETASQTEGLEQVAIRQPDNNDCYVRISGFSTAMVVDPKILQQLDICIESWRDLANSKLKGRIIFPNPAVSGAGFLALTTLLQFYGEDEGWKLVSAICQNVAEFPDSAWKPAELTGNGIIATGITVKIAATKRVSQLSSLRLVEPIDVTGVEAEVYGGLSGTSKPELVGKVLDWVQSADALSLFDKHNKVNLRMPGDNFFTIDAPRAVANRDRWLEQFKIISTN